MRNGNANPNGGTERGNNHSRNILYINETDTFAGTNITQTMVALQAVLQASKFND